jgi:hypothetical protein
MIASWLPKLNYASAGRTESHPLPLPLKNSLQLIADFFEGSQNNKLCLIFPSKEFAAQWLSFPSVVSLIDADFTNFKDEIAEKYKEYNRGDKLMLNNSAIVEWVGIQPNGVVFKTKSVGESSGAEIEIKFSQVTKLQKAPPGRQALSAEKKVKEVLPAVTKTPIEHLLNIDAKGNMGFIKNSICVITKFNRFDSAIEGIKLGNELLESYFRPVKIEDGGKVKEQSPCLIANSYLDFMYYLETEAVAPVSRMIIDGFSFISERTTDFKDIDRKHNIPTILITDLSETDCFEEIVSLGFDFFNFTKEAISISEPVAHSPFLSFDTKLNKYIAFQVIKSICNNVLLDDIARKLHALPANSDEERLTQLHIPLIQLFNILSRICHSPANNTLDNCAQKIAAVETIFQDSRIWLAEYVKSIEEIISLINQFIASLRDKPSEKSLCLHELLASDNYQFIICPTEQEVKDMTFFLRTMPAQKQPKIISVSDVNDQLVSGKRVKAILTAWPRSAQMSRILTSFIFSELTILFYEFENRYYHSLQRKNQKQYQSSRSTIDKKGIRAQATSGGFGHLYDSKEPIVIVPDEAVDIVQFELQIENAQYRTYVAKNKSESISARRIDLENKQFIFAGESHKFILVNEFLLAHKINPVIQYMKTDSLQPGDVITLINTERDTLVDLVCKMVKPQQLAEVKNLSDLWKILLREYYEKIGSDFKRLVRELRENHCKRHEITIKAWLTDDDRIGPDGDDDLVSIALITNSDFLSDNISKVRQAISQMIAWRFEAGEQVRQKIKEKLAMITDHTLINTEIDIPDLGTVRFLKVVAIKKQTESIDKKYVHRLLTKELS